MVIVQKMNIFIITCILDTFSESLESISIKLHGRSALTDQRHDGDPSVSSNHRTVHLGRVDVLHGADECVRANHIQGGDTEHTLGVQSASLLEDLTGDGDCGVDRVGDDGNHGLGTHLETKLI